MQKQELRNFFKILLPSVSSAFLCVLLAAFLVGAVFVSTSYLGSYESIQINNLHTGFTSDNPVLSWYQDIYWKVLISDKLGSIPLFLFWSAIGAVSYFTVAGVIQGIRDVKEIQDETAYIHMNRKSLLREQGERLLIRLAALIGLFFALRFTFGSALSWTRTLSEIGATAGSVLQSVEYGVSAVVIMATALHLNVVLFRLIALRVRLFSSVLPEEA